MFHHFFNWLKSLAPHAHKHTHHLSKAHNTVSQTIKNITPIIQATSAAAGTIKTGLSIYDRLKKRQEPIGNNNEQGDITLEGDEKLFDDFLRHLEGVDIKISELEKQVQLRVNENGALDAKLNEYKSQITEINNSIDILQQDTKRQNNKIDALNMELEILRTENGNLNDKLLITKDKVKLQFRWIVFISIAFSSLVGYLYYKVISF